MLQHHLADPVEADLPDAVIVGGSLAGLMSALALARTGLRAVVLERAGATARSGAALALDDAQLQRVLGPDYAQAVLAATAPDPDMRHSAVPVSWASLHAALRAVASTEPRITLRHNTRVTDIGQDPAHAWATTDDGTRYSARTVIGADGHRSIVRPHVAPEHPDAHFAGYVLWLGIAHEADLTVVGSWPTGLDIRNNGNHYLLGYPLPSEEGRLRVGSRRLGWAWYDSTRNGLFRDTGSVRGDVVHHSLHGNDIPKKTYAQLITQAQSLWPTPWREAILDTLARRQATATPIAEYVPQRLAQGRLALVGDAAHVPTPMTGSGFAESLNDAGALADCLSWIAQDESIEKALKIYEQRRLQPARELVLSGQQFSRSFASI